jgi:small subunit ribosomal protein S18
VCAFCKDPNKKIDYKSGDTLRRYLTERGKIRPRRKIGTCARHQRMLSLAIKRARHLALLPYAPEHVRGG